MSVRKYAVGDRVVIVGLPKPDTGTVVKVRQDPLPYLVDLGAPWTPAWWSGLELEPAPAAADPWTEVAITASNSANALGIGAVATGAEASAITTVEIDFAALARSHQDADRRAAHDRAVAEATRAELAKVDGDFATVEEHIAAWKAGGRRWAKVEGFNVDAWQAERDEQARVAAALPMLALAEREVAEALAQVPVTSWPSAIDEPRRYARVEPDPVEARSMCELPGGWQIADAVRHLALVVMTFTNRPLLSVVIESTHPRRVELQTAAGLVVVEAVRR